VRPVPANEEFSITETIIYVHSLSAGPSTSNQALQQTSSEAGILTGIWSLIDNGSFPKADERKKNCLLGGQF